MNSLGVDTSNFNEEQLRALKLAEEWLEQHLYGEPKTPEQREAMKGFEMLQAQAKANRIA